MTLDPPLTSAQIAAQEVKIRQENYIQRFLVALDDLGAALLDIQNDQTISSQAEIDAHKRLWYSGLAGILSDGLDLIQQSHGQRAQVGDIVRAEAVIATDTEALGKGE